MGFVGEPIDPDASTMDPSLLSQGEPDAPNAFVWREARYEIETVERRWKTHKMDRGDKYVDKHWFEVITTGGERMRLYFDRRPKVAKRWWIFSTGDMPEPAQRSDDPLARYLDDRGRVTAYPAKQSTKQIVLEYLSTKFEPKRQYTEREVNDLLNEWHTFGDWALLRRDLYDNGFINRTQDNAVYWR